MRKHNELKNMVICLDVRFRTLSGGSTSITNLVPALVNTNSGRCEFIILQYSDQNLGSLQGVRKIYVAKGNPIFELFWIQVILPHKLKRAKCNLYVSIKQPVGPYFLKIPKVYYIRNVYGKYASDEFPLRWDAYFYWYVIGKLSILKSDRLIAVSEFIRDSLTEGLRYPAAKVEVIPNGVNLAFRKLSQKEKEDRKRRLNLPDKFIFSCGNIVPVKNHETVVRAFKILKDSFPNLDLIIAGRKGTPHFKKVRDLVHDLGLGESVVFTGFVSKDELVVLYNCAEVFVFPSLTEASPNAAIEAMTCGLPIIASNRGGIRDTCGDASLYIDDPRDFYALAEGISSLLDEKVRKQFEAKCVERAKLFSWEETASKSLQVFEEVIKGGSNI